MKQENGKLSWRKASWIDQFVTWIFIIAGATAGLWHREKGHRASRKAVLRANEQLQAQTEELEKHREHLVEMVEARTGELTNANLRLKQETMERNKTEQSLRASESQLRHLSFKLLTAQEAGGDCSLPALSSSCKEENVMKQILILIALIIQVVIAESAFAAWVPVDFSGVTIKTDITLPNSLTIGGVTLSYENFGNPVDFATADIAGILGTTPGTLIFDFSAPATGLKFDFALFDTSTSPEVADALFVIFSNGDTVTVPATFDAALKQQTGSLLHNGAMFSQAFMFFSFDDPLFSVENISYEPASSIPEPATFLLLAATLFGLGSWWGFTQKRSCNQPGLFQLAWGRSLRSINAISRGGRNPSPRHLR